MNKKPVNLRRLTNQQNRLVTSEVNGENTGSVAKRVREHFVKGKTEEVATNLQDKSTEYLERRNRRKYHMIADRLQKKYLDWNVSKEKKHDGFEEISIVSKNTKPKATGQITITLKPDGDADIYINPYDHYEEFYYTMLDVRSKDCFEFPEEFHRIIEGEPAENVFLGDMIKKVEYPNYDDFDSFDPNECGTKIPETFSQEEYEEIFKKGAQAALEYAQSFQKK